MRRLLLIGVVVLVALASSAAAGAGNVNRHIIQDSFSGDTIDPDLFFVWTNQPDNVSISQHEGAATVAVAAGATNDVSAGLFTRCQVQGDFDARLAFRLPLWPLQNGLTVSLLVPDGGYNAYRVSWQFGSGDMYAAWPNQIGTPVDASGDTGTLRLTRTGSVWAGYYLLGDQWVQLSSGPGPTRDETINLTVFNLSGVLPFGGQAATIQFNRFQVVADGINCP